MFRAARKTLFALGVAYFTYLSHDKIDKTLNSMNYFFTEAEPGFAEKEQALDLKIIYEKNGKGNLETYLKSYTSRLPIYAREGGLMVGEAAQHSKNYSDTELETLCIDLLKRKGGETSGRLQHFLGKMFETWGKKP